MRITFVLPFAGIVGGVRVVAIYADHLQRRGHDVTVVSQPSGRPSPGQRLRDLLRGRGWAKPATSAPYFTNPDVRWTVLGERRPVTDSDIPDGDIVVATWWETAEWVASLDASKGAKVHFVQDHEVFPYLPVERAKAVYRLPLHKITVSQWLRDVMLDEYAANGTLVENGVNPQHFSAVPRDKRNVATIGFVFDRSPRKRADLALAAVKMAKQKIDDLTVVCFGSSPPQRQDMLPGWIDFHLRPDQAAIPGLYARCDAWLFTSESEGFGLPILEAMACGVPVIATAAGAAPQLVTDDVGFIVDPTPDAIAAKIETIAAMPPDRWGQLSRSARRAAEARDWRFSAQRFEQVLSDLVRDHHAT